MTITSRLLSPVAALALTLGALGQALAEPVAEIQPGNIMVLNVGSSPRWVLMPHEGSEYFLYVATLGEDGTLDIASHTLPIGEAPPDDPDDDPPPEETLADLVSEWADDVGDPQSRKKLAAAYQASVALVDQGSVQTIQQLLALQTLANTTVLGSAAQAWRPFFENLSDYLDANTPADLDGYREAWLEIAEGLK